MKAVHPLCWHHCKLYRHDPYSWLCSQRNATQFEVHFEQIAALTEEHGSNAATVRLQSIAAWQPQVDFYAHIASSPRVRTACEGMYMCACLLARARPPPLSFLGRTLVRRLGHLLLPLLLLDLQRRRCSRSHMCR